MNRALAEVTTSLVADTKDFQVPTSWEDTEWAVPGLLTSPTDSIHATFVPVHYESGYAYPLIVWLHEDRDNESVLPEVMAGVSTRNHLAVAPRGTIKRDENSYAWQQTSEGIAAAEDAVIEAIEEAAGQLNVHPDRVFIAGRGTGGTMALRLAMRRPEWFAGVISLEGALPRGDKPLSRINELRDLPMLLAIGDDTQRYSETELCKDISLLHAAGCEVGIRQYQGEGDIEGAMLADVDRWIMQLILG